jgi:ATP-dependent Clp protease ATP-binding subunit ClpA
MDVYRLSRGAKKALDAAEKEAVALGHGRLDTAHLLLGLFAGATAGGVAMRRSAVTDSALRSAVDEAYDGPREGGRARDLERGEELRDALEIAREETDAAGEHDIPPVRLFTAITQDDDWSAYRALRDLSVDVEVCRRMAESLARDEAQGSLPE